MPNQKKVVEEGRAGNKRECRRKKKPATQQVAEGARREREQRVNAGGGGGDARRRSSPGEVRALMCAKLGDLGAGKLERLPLPAGQRLGFPAGRVLFRMAWLWHGNGWKAGLSRAGARPPWPLPRLQGAGGCCTAGGNQSPRLAGAGPCRQTYSKSVGCLGLVAVQPSAAFAPGLHRQSPATTARGRGTLGRPFPPMAHVHVLADSLPPDAARCLRVHPR